MSFLITISWRELKQGQTTSLQDKLLLQAVIEPATALRAGGIFEKLCSFPFDGEEDRDSNRSQEKQIPRHEIQLRSESQI